MTPTKIDDGVISSGFDTPSFGVIADGQLFDAGNDCDTDPIEAAGYQRVLSAEVTAGTAYPFYAEFFVPGDAQLEVLVAGRPNITNTIAAPDLTTSDGAAADSPSPQTGAAILVWLETVEGLNEVFEENEIASVVDADYDLTDLDALILNFDPLVDASLASSFTSSVLGNGSGVQLLDAVNKRLRSEGVTSDELLANRVILDASFGRVDCTYEELQADSSSATLSCAEDLRLLEAGDRSVEYVSD